MDSAERDARVWDNVQRTGGLPKLPPGGLEIEPGAVGKWTTYLLLNDAAVDVWVHWIGNRSLPCLNALGACPPELHKCDLAIRFYIPGLDIMYGETRLLSITYDAARHCPDFCVESTSERLRGRTLDICRRAGTGVKPQRIRFSATTWNKRVPEHRNAMAALQILWSSDPMYRKWIEENVTGSPPSTDFPHPQRPQP